VANETLARRYALAIFQLAQEQKATDTVGADLRTLRDAVYEDESTKGFFLSPVVERSEKERILVAAFAGKCSEIALHALLLLVRKRRESLLREIVTQYAVLETQAEGLEPLGVTTAKELPADELRSLVANLEKIYGKRFDVRQTFDSNLIGGVRVMMGDRRIDGSVKGRLEELTRTLFTQN
jgi:F-type H+-transporting ATPase subunit delta